MKVLVIGVGNMGMTYAEGMAASPLLDGRKLMVYDISTEKMSLLRGMKIFDVYESLEACLPQAELIFLVVKPYQCPELFKTIKPLLKPEQLVISLMAGVSIKSIQEGLGICKVVRTMPNLPAQVGKGITTYTEAQEVTKEELAKVRELLNTTGKSIKVENETFIDASTGISGSGPAYVFYFMQSMIEAALRMGFSEQDSRLLVSQTFEGAVALFNNNDLSPETWMERVASKGGTTRAALDHLEQHQVKESIMDAAQAAFQRAVELGKE